MNSTTCRLDKQKTQNIPHMNIVTSFDMKEPFCKIRRAVMRYCAHVNKYATFYVPKRKASYNFSIQL